MLLHAQIASVNVHQHKIKRRSLVLQYALVSETITFFGNHLTLCVILLLGAIHNSQRSLVRFRPRPAQKTSEIAEIFYLFSYSSLARYD